VAVVVAAAALLLLVIELVEQGGRHADAPVAELLTLVAWRLPGGLRELLPLSAAVGAAVTVGALRRRGELLGLAVSGVTDGHVARGVAAGAALVVVALMAVAELVLPLALDRSAELEARVEGKTLEVAGGWALTDHHAVQIDQADGDLVHGVSVVERGPLGIEGRWDASRLRWDGEAWRGSSSYRPWRGEVTRVDAVPLPAPRELAGVLDRRAPSEQAARSLDDDSPWRLWRLGTFLLVPLWTWGVAHMGQRLPYREAGLAAGTAVATGCSWLAALSLVAAGPWAAVSVAAAVPVAVWLGSRGTPLSPG